MKIKTVFNQSAKSFDYEVNEALAEGWHLVRRFSDHQEGFIAELVQLDPEPVPEPQPLDPFEALRVVRDFCGSIDECMKCPLIDWCNGLRNGGDPTDWVIPEKEEPEA